MSEYVDVKKYTKEEIIRILKDEKNLDKAQIMNCFNYTSDFKFISDNVFYSAILELKKKGLITSYKNGRYNVIKSNEFGKYFDANDDIRDLYLLKGGKRVGIYGGLTLLAKVGLVTQQSNTIYIITSQHINKKKLIDTNFEITKKNIDFQDIDYHIIEVLEIINTIKNFMGIDLVDEYEKKIIKSIKDNIDIANTLLLEEIQPVLNSREKEFLYERDIENKFFKYLYEIESEKND